MLTRLIQQVFDHCNVGSVNITVRIIDQFKAKLWRMKKSENKTTSGGRQRKMLYEQWSHGKNSIWKLKVCYNEVDNILTKTENAQLKGEKRKLETKIEKLNAKVAKLDNKFDKEAKSALSYKNKFKKLSQKLIKIQRKPSGTRGADQKKSFSDYTKRHQLATDCGTSLSFLDT